MKKLYIGQEVKYIKETPTEMSESQASKIWQNALEEEKSCATSMVKIAEKQINIFQQRINFWNQIREENKKIVWGIENGVRN